MPNVALEHPRCLFRLLCHLKTGPFAGRVFRFRHPWLGESERVNARLQIGSNIRSEYNLPQKDLRNMMLSIGGDDTLADLLTLGISISPNRRTKFR
jgi:hypothetical protein